ncbi:class I SAM-dependent methyltransferase [bacterium]|nr:class I SAM-dependent methyltransferase [bacterium]
MAHPFPPDYFRRHDESDDPIFYAPSRKVVHIDDKAIALLQDYYRRFLPQQAVLLDLMSAWRSHLPPTFTPQRVVGVGMNDDEMRNNPQLNEFIVHDLNKNPLLPFADQTFDAATCAVSVQYLTRPLEVFKEVNRVLKPGGIFIVSFSNRCFPTKAVAVWLSSTDRQHIALVERYFAESENWHQVDVEGKSGLHDPMFIVSGRRLV